MQDISRDDFCILNGDCDKDVAPASSDSATLDHRLKLTRRTLDDHHLEPVTVKLEESSDFIYSWNVADNNIGSNLLRHSDDPLLSGAADENQNEFSNIRKAPQIDSSTTTPDHPAKANFASSVTMSNHTPAPKKTRNSAAAPRSRKKGQFKLRFHHQALPQEYLDHYEASQNNQRRILEGSSSQAKSKNNCNTLNVSSANALLSSSSVIDTPESPQDRTNENIRNWLQKISELQNEGISLTPTREDCVHLSSSPPLSTAAVKFSPTLFRFEPAVSEKQHVNNVATVNNSNPPAASSSKVVNYKDLPYMGEMTLENSKPRRGRKPKKADICHLIYKNYGTIFPGTPLDLVDSTQESLFEKNSKKLDIQNKIITSLLEKRLTIKSETNEDALPPVNAQRESPRNVKTDEPLNLCVRDKNGVVTVSSDEDGGGGIGTSKEKLVGHILAHQKMFLSRSKHPSTDLINVAENLKMPIPNFHSALLEGKPILPETPSTAESSGSVYWPNAGMFLHPMALYYQKMMDASAVSLSNTSPRTSPQLSNSRSPKILVPKNINQLMKTSPLPPVQTPARPETASSVSSSNSKSTVNSNNHVLPQKRKRSAIFIPPMPLENTSNPATEVSICKFKFTGGAKPSLQEKKMLSVDSGGNFRYYSGTGDKSMRGYEFFPRESLQQSALATGSSAGAFLNAHGEKLALETPLQISTAPDATSANPLELISESTQSSNQSSPLLMAESSSMMIPSASSPRSVNSSVLRHNPGGQSTAFDRRKRKSRRSLQREKLEKTFKEKGFLIQTQQTESAEGATYCKFRQLKKFTRYLFRSWKDYLPGDLQHQQQFQQQMQMQSQQPPSNLNLKNPGEVSK